MPAPFRSDSAQFTRIVDELQVAGLNYRRFADFLRDACPPENDVTTGAEVYRKLLQTVRRRGFGSPPSYRLEPRRAGGGQAITYGIHVRCRDVDSQQHGALRDRSLQGFGSFLW